MLSEALAAALQATVGEEGVSTAQAERALHAADQSSHPPVLPDVVVWPRSTAEVSAVMRLAADHRIPVVGWGAGSSLEGNPIPLRGGIVVDFGRMNAIVAVHAADFQVTVQPGMLYKDMNRRLAAHGLFFAPDPGANASIGGMVANNAAGTRTVKYGAVRDNVLALEVVLADGSVIRTGSRAVKQSAGYDLTHLFTGSEGTLGLITEATLKLYPLPEHFSAVLASFPSTPQAAEAVYGVMGAGLGPAALELLDGAAVAYMNTLETIDLPVAPTLLMEFHGATAAAVEAELALVRQICADCGCTRFEAGVGRAERDRLWEGRHLLGEILFRAHPHAAYLITDVAVPISRYPELAAYTNQLFAELTVHGALFGHAGDGNLHTVIFAPQDDPAQRERLRLFNDHVVQKALALGGTCTGEHGVGIGKQKYMLAEHGPGALALMRRLKGLLDPLGILNPGKVVG